MTSREVLAHMGVKQDFTVLEGGSQEGPLRIDYIHRRCENADVYFVCNSAKETKSLLCRFRDADGRPEVWCPVTGMIYLANVVQRHDDGACDIALDLPAFGSAIVVFRRDGVAPERTAEPPATKSAERTFVEGTWTVKFQPGRRAPESVRWDRLIDWTTSDVDGIRYFSGTATYSMQFEMPVHAQTDHWLDLGEVREVAEVNLDGKPLGTAWTYPFRVRVPAGLLTRGMHELEVTVTNVWNNRLVGDKFLDATERITRTNMQHVHNKNTSLVPSGLLGPVTLKAVR